jgi:hypothetical protein
VNSIAWPDQRIDAGGGFQNYPDDYQVIEQLAKDQQLTVRIAYNLFTQKPKEELTDFKNWTSSVTLHQGDDYLRHNGAGEMLVFSAADFEDFLEPRPDLPQTMEDGTGTGGAPFGRAALAVPFARHLQRIHQPHARRVREGQPRHPFNGLPWFSIMPKPSPRKPSSG